MTFTIFYRERNVLFARGLSLNKKFLIFLAVPFLFACGEEKEGGSSSVPSSPSSSQEELFNFWNEGKKKTFERKDDFYTHGIVENCEDDVFKNVESFEVSQNGLSFFERRFTSKKPRREDGNYIASTFDLLCLKEIKEDGVDKYVSYEEKYSEEAGSDIKRTKAGMAKDFLETAYHVETPLEEFEGLALEGFDTYEEFQNVFQSNAIEEFGMNAKNVTFQAEKKGRVSLSYDVYVEIKEEDMPKDYLYTAITFNVKVSATYSYVRAISYTSEAIEKYAEGKEKTIANVDLKDSFAENIYDGISIQ